MKETMVQWQTSDLQYASEDVWRGGSVLQSHAHSALHTSRHLLGSWQ